MFQNDLEAKRNFIYNTKQLDYFENLLINKHSLESTSMKPHGFKVTGSYINKIIKKKRHRTAFTTDQLLVLEKTFSDNKYIDREKRKTLSNTLMISEKSVKVWFQNRRMKNKRLSHSSCDSSSDVSVSTHVKSDQTNENIEYQWPNRYNISPRLNDHNLYPQYDQQQSYQQSDYTPLSTGHLFKNGEIHPSQYSASVYPHDYQCYVDYNNYENNHNWQQQNTSMCYLGIFTLNGAGSKNSF